MISPIRFDGLSTFSLLKYVEPAMPIILSIWLGVFILAGIALSYHWKEYGYNIIAAWIFTFCYFAIGAGLLAGMFIAQLSF